MQLSPLKSSLRMVAAVISSFSPSLHRPSEHVHITLSQSSSSHKEIKQETGSEEEEKLPPPAKRELGQIESKLRRCRAVQDEAAPRRLANGS